MSFTDTLITRFRHKDLSALRQLAEGYRGANYLEVPLVSEHTCLVARQQGTIVGFVLFTQGEAVSAATRRHLVAEGLAAPMEGVAWIKDVVVAPTAAGGNAVEQGLLAAAVGQLNQQAAALVLLAAWISPDGISLDALARRQGFHILGGLPSHWREASLARGYRCRVCGTPPCECNAVLYAKRL